jgi:hypothetical protein
VQQRTALPPVSLHGRRGPSAFHDPTMAVTDVAADRYSLSIVDEALQADNALSSSLELAPPDAVLPPSLFLRRVS